MADDSVVQAAKKAAKDAVKKQEKRKEKREADQKRELNMRDLRLRYGFVRALIDDYPQLKKLWEKAIRQGWEATRFQAELQATDWYKKHSESARKTIALQKTDPASWRRKVDQVVGQIRQRLAEVGGTATDAQIQDLAKRSILMGMTDQEVVGRLRKTIDYSTDGAGSLTGSAGSAEDAIRGFAAANGVVVSDAWVLKHARGQAVAGQGNTAAIDAARDWINRQAALLYPSLSAQLGQRGPDGAYTTVEDLAGSYKQALGKVLELDPDQVSLQDKALQKALQGVDGSGPMALWQFEKELRRDERWKFTSGARKEASDFANKVLADFGFLPSGGGQ